MGRRTRTDARGSLINALSPPELAGFVSFGFGAVRSIDLQPTCTWTGPAVVSDELYDRRFAWERFFSGLVSEDFSVVVT